MKFSIFIWVVLAFALTINGSLVNLKRRRFGQEHSSKAEGFYNCVNEQAQGTGLEADAGALVNITVFALLAKAGPCDQQDAADKCIDLADRIEVALQNKTRRDVLTECCKKYRQLERNTNGVGVQSPNCTRPPRHKELEGLVQAQDPTGLKTTAGFPKEPETKTPIPTTTKKSKRTKCTSQTTEKPKRTKWTSQTAVIPTTTQKPKKHKWTSKTSVTPTTTANNDN
ncbi:26148_t:CDS:2 [Racocetra persica]|uniref:26148_t:CDS:1 n=1 Tax=Racocetra persica TaxID=160502 RepID=A0ACA9MWP4_9GLOM|nr:26148_t:CDS:2 [Racocetra persica]